MKMIDLQIEKHVIEISKTVELLNIFRIKANGDDLIFTLVRNELNKRVEKHCGDTDVLAWSNANAKREFMALIEYTLLNPMCFHELYHPAEPEDLTGAG